MSQFSPSHVLATLDRILADSATGRLWIAFSGGLDSTVLLHAVVAILGPNSRLSPCAIHIDHQLHSDSDRWQEHCANVARTAGVSYLARRVTVDARNGGVEAAARQVRHNVFRELMQPGDVLLTAHHADDQLETVLLALMRGAGVNGLAAMPACQAFGVGFQVRPLLEFTRAELEQWARERKLSWLTDPSNDSPRFDRNYLRSQVLPLLRARWPAASRNSTRTAAHLAEAAALLDGVAADDLATVACGNCLRVDQMAQLEPRRQRNVLRVWLRSRGARAPSTRKLAALQHDMLVASHDRSPCVAWDDFEVRRHRGLLYADAKLPAIPEATLELAWRWLEPIRLPAGLGALRTESGVGIGLATSKLPHELRICFRTGGEQLRIAGHAHRHQLKKLLQDAQVLPWWRSRIPLLYVGNQLAAVGDLWIAQEFAAGADDHGVQIVWEERPCIEAHNARP